MIPYKMIALKFGHYLDNDLPENETTPTKVAALADPVLVMRNGREVESGMVTDVRPTRKSNYTKALLAAARVAPHAQEAKTTT